jgi:hypothetical protein
MHYPAKSRRLDDERRVRSSRTLHLSKPRREGPGLSHAMSVILSEAKNPGIFSH